MNDKRNINVVIADVSFPMTVKSDKEEEFVRKAAKQVNYRLNMYRNRYVNENKERLLSMVAVHFAFEELLQEDRHDTAPFTQKIIELTKDIEDFMKEG